LCFGGREDLEGVAADVRQHAADAEALRVLGSGGELGMSTVGTKAALLIGRPGKFRRGHPLAMGIVVGD